MYLSLENMMMWFGVAVIFNDALFLVNPSKLLNIMVTIWSKFSRSSVAYMQPVMLLRFPLK